MGQVKFPSLGERVIDDRRRGADRGPGFEPRSRQTGTGVPKRVFSPRGTVFYGKLHQPILMVKTN